MQPNFFFVIFFLLILAAILFVSHFFIYFSLARFFGVTDVNAKTWLAVILFILGIGFIVSSLLAHYNENLFTKIFYFISGIWLGMVLNLLVAFTVTWAVIIISKLAGYQIGPKYLAVAAIILSLTYLGYGIWNAYHPKLHYVTVKIKNLPDQWRGKTAVQISDVHLGHIFGADFMDGVTKQINSVSPDVVFITGDLFDGMDGELDALIKPLGNIKASEGVYFVTGNHETYLGVSNAFDALRKTPVKILDDKMVNLDGMQIVGVSYPEREETKNIEETIKNMSGFDPNNPSILLYHDPSQFQRAKDSGISLQLAGHTHKGQIFPLQVIFRLIYGKYYNGLNTDGDFSIYTSNGVGTWGPTVRTMADPEIAVIHFTD